MAPLTESVEHVTDLYVGGRNFTVALMYHAVGAPSGPAADPHYTIPPSLLFRHLESATRIGGAALSGQKWLQGQSGILVTFDDGHESNYRVALPILLDAHATADFFVNPRQVGTPGYVTWPHLREMADAGMSIQSHSLDHRFLLTQLSPAALRENLRTSREEIEQNVGRRVTLLAPPGGRSPAGLEQLAQACGYTHVFNSKPGRILSRADRTVGRLAVTARVSLDTFESWLHGGTSLLEAQARYSVLRFAKQAMGEQTYDRVRSRLLRRPNDGLWAVLIRK